jgi:hypothetical protein
MVHKASTSNPYFESELGNSSPTPKRNRSASRLKSAHSVDTIANDRDCQLQIWKVRCKALSDQYLATIDALKSDVKILKNEVKD